MSLLLPLIKNDDTVPTYLSILLVKSNKGSNHMLIETYSLTKNMAKISFE